METEKIDRMLGIRKGAYNKKLKRVLEKYGFKLEPRRANKNSKHQIYTSERHGRLEAYVNSNWFAFSVRLIGNISAEVADEIYYRF
jgi:hypothetical protein